MDTMRVRTVVWHPRIATTLLGLADPGNRRVRTRRVEMYAADMAKGEWQPNSLIEFGGDLDTHEGLVLWNGHHRLQALAQCHDVRPEVKVGFIVADRVPEAARAVMDTGTPRSTGDLLHYETNGVAVDAQTIAAALRLYWRWRVHPGLDPRGAPNPANHWLLDLYRLHPEVARAADTARLVVRGATGLNCGPPSVFATAWMVFMETDEDDAREFFERLGTGDHVGDGDPTWTLRQTVQRAYLKNRPLASSPLQREVLLALIVTAWGKFRKGEQAHRLIYRPRDPFPEVL